MGEEQKRRKREEDMKEGEGWGERRKRIGRKKTEEIEEGVCVARLSETPALSDPNRLGSFCISGSSSVTWASSRTASGRRYWSMDPAVSKP